MITLLIKDLRQTFWPALLAVLLLVAPLLAWTSGTLSDPRGTAFIDVFRELSVCAALGACASLLASSSVAGVAFARERRERTADMVGTLPIPRWRVVACKATAALLITGLPVAIGAAACAIFTTYADRSAWAYDGTAPQRALALAAAWLLLFGLGWGLSTVLRSEVLAAAAPVLMLIVLGAAVFTWGRPEYGVVPFEAAERVVYTRIAWVLGPLGAAGLIGGTVVALRRKSP